MVNNISGADLLLAHDTKAIASPEGDPHLVELETTKAVPYDCAKHENKENCHGCW